MTVTYHESIDRFTRLAALEPGVHIAPGEVQSIRDYIKQSWGMLTRSVPLLLLSAHDPKAEYAHQLMLYIAPDEDPVHIGEHLRASLPESDFERVLLRPLPDDPTLVPDSGLLYLPYPYVVPGGRFNEMYGWDSYFTLLGLLRDGEWLLAKAMTDNLLYEIAHYGMILNANRAYYLTRSQPPFITQMLLEDFRVSRDREWLANALPLLDKYYDYWLRPPHTTPSTGLARYWGNVDTPAPEVVQHETDYEGRNHYTRAREYYRTQPVQFYDVARYYDAARDELTPLFYIADRAVRESGFDLSARFGPFSADIISYNSVDINALLYLMERDMALILRELESPSLAATWDERAAWRAEQMNTLMWNEAEGLYFDYNFETGRQSPYRFLTTFYPLWVGAASEAQAARVAANLPIFERRWGLQASDCYTGHQWDAPFGWAPLHIIAAEGLRRYGLHAAANRISVKFLSLVLKDFLQHGTIKEKYDVEAGESDLGRQIQFGYVTNEVGFGWTNAAFLLLLENLR